MKEPIKRIEGFILETDDKHKLVKVPDGHLSRRLLDQLEPGKRYQLEITVSDVEDKNITNKIESIIKPIRRR